MLQIKAGDANIKFGLLLQPQVDWTQNTTVGYQQNLLIRRLRLVTGGQFTKTLYFFAETENARLGAALGTAAKVISTGFQWLDAAIEWRTAKEFNLQAGLIRVPVSREGLKASGSSFPLDFSAYAFTAGAALGGLSGRDTGFMARGYLANDHFEYRAAIVAGLRETGSRNPFRGTGRIQYNFFDTEVYNMPSYPGSYLGTKKILALGAAYDLQRSYKGYTADAYADIPISAGAVLGTVQYHHLDGGKFAASLGKSNILQAEGGVYVQSAKLGAWARYEQRKFSPSTTKDEKRYGGGLNYYVAKHTFNIKAGYVRLSVNDPKIKNTGEFTIQLQAYYF